MTERSGGISRGKEAKEKRKPRTGWTQESDVITLCGVGPRLGGGKGVRHQVEGKHDSFHSDWQWRCEQMHELEDYLGDEIDRS